MCAAFHQSSHAQYTRRSCTTSCNGVFLFKYFGTRQPSHTQNSQDFTRQAYISLIQNAKLHSLFSQGAPPQCRLPQIKNRKGTQARSNGFSLLDCSPHPNATSTGARSESIMSKTFQGKLMSTTLQENWGSNPELMSTPAMAHHQQSMDVTNGILIKLPISSTSDTKKCSTDSNIFTKPHAADSGASQSTPITPTWRSRIHHAT